MSVAKKKLLLLKKIVLNNIEIFQCIVMGLLLF